MSLSSGEAEFYGVVEASGIGLGHPSPLGRSRADDSPESVDGFRRHARRVVHPRERLRGALPV